MREVDYIVVGGGLPSLVLAQYIANDNPCASVAILEKDAVMGGQYSSAVHEKYGCLDYGMHVYYDTCDAELDRILEDALPASEWHLYENNEKDPCGIFWDGKLQLNIPYPDLRDWPVESKAKFLFEMLSASGCAGVMGASSLREALVRHFGPSLVEEVFAPIYKRTYRLDVSEMAEVAWKFQAMNRVVLFDEEIFLRLMDSSSFRSKVATTSQFSEHILPFKQNGQRALYPKKYGFSRVIDGLLKNLKSSGVELLFPAKIDSAELEGDHVACLHLGCGESIRARKHIFWTAGLMPLRGLLAPKVAVTSTVDFGAKPQINYVYFILKRPPKIKDVYYIYSFARGGQTFRVALYPNYCKGQFEQDGVAKVCSEFWVYPKDGFDEDAVIERARRELLEMGVLESADDIIDTVLKKQAFGGIPSPTNKFFAEMKSLGDELKGYVGGNVSLGGVFSDNQCFFVHEVIKDNVAKYNAVRRGGDV